MLRALPLTRTAVRVQLWDLAAGKVLHEFPPHAGAVTATECAAGGAATDSCHESEFLRRNAGSTHTSSC